MKPSTLLQELMDAAEPQLNPSSLAAALRNKPSQPVIFRFLSGEASEPRKSTLSPIARHFGIPLEALIDERAAHRVAIERGFIKNGIAGPKEPPQRPPRASAIDVVLQLDELLSGVPPATKRGALALLSGLADEEHDAQFLGRQLKALMDSAKTKSA